MNFRTRGFPNFPILGKTNLQGLFFRLTFFYHLGTLFLKNEFRSQKMDFYEDLGNVGGTFTKFFYNVPHPSTEAVWCTPNFNCCDPMGLFYRYVDVRTFNILMFDIFKMRGTAYRPWGHQQYEYDTLKVLFQFAERWCAIHGLSDEESSDYNYKLTLWVVSRIMLYLND